jgi:enoyl-CoA hydratase/carnithine racemase
MELVKTRSAGHVFYITINRPEVYNALCPHTYHALSLALDEMEADDNIWLGVLTGEGDKAFSAGRDLKQMAAMAKSSTKDKKDEEELWSNITRLTDRFNFYKPLIARLNGLAFGGGLELALACDIIVAADHAKMALPEPTRGLIATAGGVHRLPRQIGLKAAMGYLLTGRTMSAQKAYDLGLVNQVVSYKDIDDAIDEWIKDILRCAPLAIRATKQSVMEGLNYPLQEALPKKYSWEEARKKSIDSIEGPLAFSEKRDAIWKGK